MNTELWVLAFGAAVAGLVQGISGFAFSMVAVSIWVWGLDPKFAATMAVFGGWLVVVSCAIMLATDRLPKVTRGGKAADVIVGLFGGVMGQLAGFSGLAPAVWTTLRDYNKDAQRAVLQNFNLAVLSWIFLSNVWTGVIKPATMWPQLAIVAGAMILPAIWGSKIYLGMSAVAFRKTVLWLLVLAGMVMLSASLKTLL